MDTHETYADHRRVVVGIGPHGKHDAALEYAAHEARRRGCGVHLVVVEHPLFDEGRAVSDLELLDGELRRADTGLLEECRARLEELLGDVVPVTSELTHGGVASALVAVAHDAELVVLQHHHMGRPFHLPTLSVTNAVASRAAAPVVAVPDDWHEGDVDSDVVVACVEDVATGALVARAAFEQAARLRGRVRLLRSWAWTDDDFETDAGRLTATAEERSALLRDELVEAFRPLREEYADVACEVVVRHGQPGWVLVEGGDQARLLVIGRHRPAYRFGSHLGPLTRTVLTHVRVPVLVVDTRA